MKNRIVVYDFETICIFPLNEFAPCEVACIILDGDSLKELPNSRFTSLMKPLDEKYIQPKALEVNKRSIEELRTAPLQKQVVEAFVKHIHSYDLGGKPPWNLCVAAGHNICNFDNHITNALLSKYNLPQLFHPRDTFDTMQMCGMWMRKLPEVTSYSMDFLRKYMEMPTDESQTHSALYDVLQTAGLLRKFMGLHERLAATVQFKGCFAGKSEKE